MIIGLFIGQVAHLFCQSCHFYGISVPTGMVTLPFSLGASLVSLDKKIVQPTHQVQAPTKHWLMKKIWDDFNPVAEKM